jgi:hypothetical protein
MEPLQMTGTPSKFAVLMARIAVVLLVTLIVAGIVWYGISAEVLARSWRNIIARPGGPMTFRFILQPAMAGIIALRDGINDARFRRSPYLSAIIHGTDGRGSHLWEGVVATAKILILGIVMDIVYQLTVLGTFYPAESALIAILLAFVPYALLRGPVRRVASSWITRPASD